MNQVTTQLVAKAVANVPARRQRTSASILAERVRDFACTLGGCGAGCDTNGDAGCEAGRASNRESSRDAEREASGELWVRAAGRHIIVGRGEHEAFARITPLGEDAYGLAFRAPARPAGIDSGVGGANGANVNDTCADTDAALPSRWAPLLLIDALADVVEHALIGEGAMDQPALCM